MKSRFSWESYLDHSWKFNDRRSTARIRCSAHKLNCELGRHRNIPRHERTCDYCIKTGAPLPEIENERHILNRCPLGRNIRDAFELKLERLTSKLQVLNVESLFATVGFQASTQTTQSDNGTTRETLEHYNFQRGSFTICTNSPWSKRRTPAINLRCSLYL